MEQTRALAESWKRNTLSVLLKLQALAWLPGYLAGVWNAFHNYEKTTAEPIAALRTLLLSLSLYTAAYGLLLFTAFFPRLSERTRVVLMLGMYYALSIGLFWLSALSGDARLILLIFLLFAAIFLEPPYPYVALGLAMLNFGLMGWLHVSGFIQLAEPTRYNAHDPSSWLTGGIVFFIIGLTTIYITQYLFLSFLRTLAWLQITGQFVSLENEINQEVARQHERTALLQTICQILERNGYPAWLGLRAGDEPGREWTSCQSDEDESLRGLVEQAINLNQSVESQSRLAIPLLRGQRCLGAMLVSLKYGETAEKEFFEKVAANLAHALDAIKNQARREKFTSIAQELLGERNEDTIWQVALQAARNLLETDRAAVYEYDPDSDRLSCQHFSGLSPEYVEQINRIFREIPGGQLLSNSQPLVIEDVHISPLTQNIRSLLESEHIRAYAVFPLFLQKRLIGAFVVYYRYPHSFSPADIEAGQTLAHFLIAALQNARLFAETRAKSNEQAALFMAAEEMSARVSDFSALLNLLSHQMAAALHVTSTYLLDVNEKDGTLTVLSEYWAEEACVSERVSDLGRAYPISDFPLILTVARQGLPLVLYEDDPRLSESERREFWEYGVKTKLFLPLLWQGDLVGLAELWESRYRRSFTQHEIHLAQALASHAAGALRTARLFAELETREAYFRALTEHAAEGVAVLDRQGSFKYISPVQEQMLGYDTECISIASLKQKIHPEDLLLVRKAFLRSLRFPKTLVSLTFRIQNSKGRWRVLEATLNNLLENPAIQGVVVNFRDVTRQKQAEEQLRQAYDETLAGWARALELRDKDTEGHTRRVTDLTLRLARAMKVDEEQLVHIRRGALLHDIGKVAIPDSILHKTDTLTVQEWETMCRHPQYAYDMLKDIAYLRPALDIPYCHHEKWDGTGYPRGLKGREIPLAARIFAIADVWDALTSDRPYRPGWERERALRYIQEQAGKQFDPEIVALFVALVQKEEIP